MNEDKPAILNKEAKQSWDSNKIVIVIDSSVVATFHHSSGNGISGNTALAIAQQFVDSWNDRISKP